MDSKIERQKILTRVAHFAYYDNINRYKGGVKGKKNVRNIVALALWLTLLIVTIGIRSWR